MSQRLLIGGALQTGAMIAFKIGGRLQPSAPARGCMSHQAAMVENYSMHGVGYVVMLSVCGIIGAG